MTYQKSKQKPYYKRKSRTYISWGCMWQRVNDGKGIYQKIKICKRWKNFENFLKDIGERPEGTTLDRINNNGNYCKKNCRWATMAQQNSNRSDSVLITFKGKRKNIGEWDKSLGGHPGLIKDRLDRGWSLKKALTKPAGRLEKNITLNGVTKSITEWAISLGGRRGLVRNRISRGWSIKRALTTRTNKK